MQPTEVSFEIYTQLKAKMNPLGRFMMFAGYFSMGIDGAIINGLSIQNKRMFVKKSAYFHGGTKCQ